MSKILADILREEGGSARTIEDRPRVPEDPYSGGDVTTSMLFGGEGVEGGKRNGEISSGVARVRVRGVVGRVRSLFSVEGRSSGTKSKPKQSKVDIGQIKFDRLCAKLEDPR